MACGCGCGGNGNAGGGGSGSSSGQPESTSLLTGTVNLPVELNAKPSQVGQQWIFVRPARFVPPAGRASDK